MNKRLFTYLSTVACLAGQALWNPHFASKVYAASPTLSSSTQFGSDGYDRGNIVKLDRNGYVYLLATVSTYGDKDLLILKFAPGGEKLVAGTLIGGTGDDYGEGMGVDDAGNVYVTANSWSFDKANTPDVNEGFPLTPNGYSPSEDGAPHGVFFKLDPRLVLAYSTRLPTAEFGGVAVDKDGFAYVTGSVGSKLPTTPGVVQPTDEGCGWDATAFLAKFDASKSGAASLVYSTYLTGSGCGEGKAVAVDEAGNAYVAGQAMKSGMPVTSNAPQKGLSATFYTGDSFVMKISPDASQRLFSTYFGGKYEEDVAAITIDKAHNIYFVGFTSLDYPTTPNAVQSQYNPGDCDPSQGTYTCVDSFVTKIAEDGSVVYATYLGGTLQDNAQGIAADDDGNAYVSGQSMSLDFPLLNPPTDSQGGSRDAYVTVLNPTGSQILFSTMIGGDDEDAASSIVLDPERKKLYTTGYTYSDGYPKVNPLAIEGFPGTGPNGNRFYGDVTFNVISLDGATGPIPATTTGDANLDEKVDVSDAILVLQSTVGMGELTPAQKAAADVTHDSQVDVADAVKILKVVVGADAF